MRANRGDHVYVAGKAGPTCGKVLAHGEHGCTVEIGGKRHRVPWGKVLGWRKRASSSYRVVDVGEDGSIVQDDDGKRHYLGGQIPDPEKYTAPAAKVKLPEPGDILTRRVEQECKRFDVYHVAAGALPEADVLVFTPDPEGVLSRLHEIKPEYQALPAATVRGGEEEGMVLLAFKAGEHAEAVIQAAEAAARDDPLGEDIVIAFASPRQNVEEISVKKIGDRTVIVGGHVEGAEARPGYLSGAALQKALIIFGKAHVKGHTRRLGGLQNGTVLKAGPIAYRHGLSLRYTTEKRGHQVRRWKRDFEPEERRKLTAEGAGEGGGGGMTPESEAERQFLDTERAYGGRPAWEKAKTDGKTKLTYGQWVTVRTPNFLRWFGDWLIPANAKMLRSASTFREAKDAAGAFRGSPLFNYATGMTASVPRDALDKMLSESSVKKSESPSEHALAVANLDVLFENAVFGWSKTDKEGDPNVKAIHRMFATMRTGNAVRLVKLTVKESALSDQGSRIYSVEAIEVGKGNPVPEMVDADRTDGSRLLTGPTGFINSLVERAQKFNADTVSKVIDPDTGEPLVVYHGRVSPLDRDNGQISLSDGLFGRGFYTAVAPHETERYAGRELPDMHFYREGGHQLPLFLRILSPFTMGQGTRWNGRDIADLAPGDPAGQRSAAIAAGYDGVRVLNEGIPDFWVAFHPESVKSATGNIGTFDPKEGDIRKSAVLFFKAERIKNAPGLALQDTTDKLGHQVKRWKRTTKDQPAEKRRAKPDEPPKDNTVPKAERGEHVTFTVEGEKGSGLVLFAGKDGATVKDVEGAEHKVLWSEIQEGGKGGREPGGKTPRAMDAGDSKKPDYEPRRDGESDKDYAKRVVDKTDAPDKLPEEHNRYFHIKDSKRVPLDRLHPTKSVNEKIADNGRKRLQAAYHGALGKRDPITVMPHKEKEGHFEVLDGNGTLVAAKKLGWKGLPTRQVTREEGERMVADARAKEIAKSVHAGHDIGSLAKSAVQPVKTKDELYGKAKETMEQLRDWLNRGRGVAAKMGYTTMTKPPEEVGAEEWDQHEGMLFIAPLKGEARAAEKVESDYGGDWSKLTDVVRCTLAADNLHQVSDMIHTLMDRGMKLAKQPKNRFLSPTKVGYMDMNYIIEMPNGILAEVQFNVKDMLRAKNDGHPYYETARKIVADQKTAQGVTDDDELDFSKFSAEDRKRFQAAINEQMRIYGDAWHRHVLKHYGSEQALQKGLGEVLRRRLRRPGWRAILPVWKRA